MATLNKKIKDRSQPGPAGSARVASARARELPIKTGVKSGRVRIRTANTPPPVLVRGARIGIPMNETPRAQKARRRYDVALGVPGAEMRLPTAPFTAIGWRGLSLLVAIALAVLLYQMWNMPNFQVDAARVGGLKRISSQEVNAALDAGKGGGLHGAPIFAVDGSQLKGDLLAAFPEFSAVSVSIGLPNSVEITVTERTPVLTWVQAGNTQLVDAEGMAFPLRTPGNQENQSLGIVLPVVEASGAPVTTTVSLPQISDLLQSAGAEGEAGQLPNQAEKSETDGKVGATALLSKELVSAILALSTQAPQDTPMVYDNEHGLGWQDGRGWQVFFGDSQDIEMKLKVYEAILQRLESDGIRPVLISVEYVHAPYFRMEP